MPSRRTLVAVVLAAILMAPLAASSGGWVLTTFYPASTSGLYIGVADIAGTGGAPSAAIFDSWGNRVLYASDPLGGSGFQQVPLTVPTTGILTMRLAVAADGTPHIFLLRDTGQIYSLGYATLTPGGWNVQTVSTGASVSAFRLYGAAVDAAGVPHALVGIAANTVILTALPAGWAARHMGPNTNLPHMVASPSGTIHVCLNSVDGVVHVHGAPLGTMTQETVYPSLIQNGRCSIAAPSDADVRIVFDASPRRMYHADKTPTGWNVAQLPTPVFGAEIPFSRAGSNAAGGDFAVVRAIAFGMRLYAHSGGAWTDETPASLSSTNANPSMAPGATRPYVAAASAGLHIWSHP